MLSWLPQLLGLIPAGLTTIQGITSAISNEKIAGITAKTDQEKIASAERVAGLEAQRDLMIASTQKSNIDIYLRAIAAAGPISYVLKIFLWDKVVGSFMGCVGHTGVECNLYTTDQLSDANLIWIVGAVIGCYFLTTVRK